MPRPITIVVVLTLALLELAAFLVPCPGVAQTHQDVEPVYQGVRNGDWQEHPQGYRLMLR